MNHKKSGKNGDQNEDVRPTDAGLDLTLEL
jgi:hypothetical protein